MLQHPRSALLQQARASQQRAAFAPYRKLRQAAEYRLARLMELGVRPVRYCCRPRLGWCRDDRSVRLR